MTLFITILNFDTGSVDILRIETQAEPGQIDSEVIEEVLEFRGYKKKNIQYMVTEQLSINML